MNEHKKHHSKKHIREMLKMMAKGMSFKKSHDMTMKKVGK